MKIDDWHRTCEESAKEIQQEITNNTQTKCRKIMDKSQRNCVEIFKMAKFICIFGNQEKYVTQNKNLGIQLKIVLWFLI